jgi:hypothetical protein
MTMIGQWTCPTCNAVVASPFCPDCGENGRHTHEPTLKVLFSHFLEAFTNIDGRLIRSFRYLVTQPGARCCARFKTLALSVAIAVAVLGYRLALLFVTLYRTCTEPLCSTSVRSRSGSHIAP